MVGYSAERDVRRVHAGEGSSRDGAERAEYEEAEGTPRCPSRQGLEECEVQETAQLRSWFVAALHAYCLIAQRSEDAVTDL